MTTDPRHAELLEAVQVAGCNRVSWPVLAHLADHMLLDPFTDESGHIDPTAVADWVAVVLPERRGPDWATVEALCAADGRHVEVHDHDLGDEGVTTSTSTALLRADRRTLILGYEEGPDDAA